MHRPALVFVKKYKKLPIKKQFVNLLLCKWENIVFEGFL